MIFAIYHFLIYAFFIVCKIASDEKIKYSEDFAPVSIEELSFKAGLQKESLQKPTQTQTGDKFISLTQPYKGFYIKVLFFMKWYSLIKALKYILKNDGALELNLLIIFECI